MKLFSSIFLITLLILGLHIGCKKKKCQIPTNPECENYDPCYGKLRTYANFRFYSRLARYGINNKILPDTLIEIDTVGGANGQFGKVVFKPNNLTYSKYEWQLENDTTKYNEQSIIVSFNKPYGNVNISLNVQGENQTSCFSNDTGYASYTKSLYITKISQTPIMGKWRGFFLEKKDSIFEIEITGDDNNSFECYIKGWRFCPPPYSVPAMDSLRIGTQGNYFVTDGTCFYQNLIGYYNKYSKKLYIDCVYQDRFKNNKKSYQHFIGTKIY